MSNNNGTTFELFVKFKDGSTLSIPNVRRCYIGDGQPDALFVYVLESDEYKVAINFDSVQYFKRLD